jgi:Protein of unknown function (DUF3800)
VNRERSLTYQLCRAATARKPPHWAVVFETLTFEAYFDETGPREQDALVTGAAFYVANAEQWFNFEQAWSAVLQRPEFDLRFFHATDYANSKDQFQGWDNAKKLALAKCLFPILLPPNTWIGHGYGIVNRDWADAIKGHDRLRALMGKPFMLCVQRLMEILLQYFRPLPSDHRVAVFFEDNDFKGEITKLWDNWLKPHDPQDRLISLNFAGKRDFVPLQAADFLAYESYKEIDRVRFDRPRPKRKSLELVEAAGNVRALMWDRENLPKAFARLERILDMDAPR